MDQRGAYGGREQELPQGVAVDGNGNVYIADTGNNKVRKVDTTGTITTFAGTGMSGSMGDGGSATSARLSAPRDVAVDGSGNVYIADTGNNKVRKVDTGGVITTFAGGGATTACTASGSPTAVSMSGPRGIAVDSAGAVYVADTGRNCIRKIAAGSLSQVAGGGASSGCAFAGSATAAVLNTPSDVAVDASGAVYVADTANNCVRKVAAGAISLLAGNGANTACAFVGAATSASLSGPLGATVDSSGRIVIADSGRNCVRLVTGTNVELMAGTGTAGSTGDNGPAIAALVNAPNGVAASSTGAVWVADTSNNRVRRVVGPF